MTKKVNDPQPKDWETYEEGTQLLYSYLKKKGKHKIAKANDKDKTVRGRT